MNRLIIIEINTVKHFIFARLKFRGFGDFADFGVLKT